MKDDERRGSWRPSTRSDNGDYHDWLEYQAELNRDPREYQGSGDSDPRYDLEPILGSSLDTFIQDMEKFFDGQDTTKNRIDDRQATTKAE